MDPRIGTFPSFKQFVRNVSREFEDDYRTRIMITSCLALGVLIIAVRLPLDLVGSRIGWLNGPIESSMTLEVVQVAMPSADGGGESVPVTDFGLFEEEIVPEDADDGLGEEVAMDVDPASRRMEKIRAREVLNFAEQQPEIMGGLSSYYLNIDYPLAAREAGIQGRLVLSFVVEPTGRPSNIKVEQSLHPLCDSAAVAALEKSQFIAGRQAGRKVRVRMRLPVRFTLLEMPELPALTESRAQ